MEDKKIKEFLEKLTKSELREVIELAKIQLNSTLGVGDSVTLTIEYMIGDADGDTEESMGIDIESEDDLNALDIIQHILENHTSPNKGNWGFGLSQSEFSNKKKSKEVYNILYDREKAPEMYNGIKITPRILDVIEGIVSECFRSDTEYSFLTYEGVTISQ